MRASGDAAAAMTAGLDRIRVDAGVPTERGQITGALLDGPLAFDNAISKEAAAIKGIRSQVAGDADILLVDEVLAKNAKQVEDYRAGKEKAFNSLVGQVMKATQGKANPKLVIEILMSELLK